MTRRALPKNLRHRKTNERVILAEGAPIHEQPKSRNCVAGADSPLNRRGWPNLVAAECLSVSAATRLAAWQCSPAIALRFCRFSQSC
jgi:hypothetical protein